MLLRDLMTRDVQVIDPGTPLAEAARTMRELGVGSLPVCDGRVLVGMLTDRDIVTRATAEGRDAGQTTVAQAMTPRVVFCYEDQDVRDAAALMEQEQIRRLPVLNRRRELTGIVSLADLAVDDDDVRLSAEVIRAVSRPAHPTRGGPH